MPKTAIVDSEGEVTTNAITELISGASASSSSSNEVATSASASASASASSSSSSASASEVQVLLDSPPFTRSESNVVEQLGVDKSQSLPQSSQEVTESMQITQSEKRAEEKVLSPNSVTETMTKKSQIEPVRPEETWSEIEEEDEGSGMDRMDDGEDEESNYAFSDDDQEYVNE